MNTQKGFTLLELMIVVVIVAILAAVAIPSYQSHMIKTRRVTAAACLQEMAQWMERSYTTAMSYADLTLPAMQCSTDLTDYYTFSLTDQTARTYAISAAPQGAQSTGDPLACGTLTIDQAGQKGAGATDVSACWK